MNDPDLEKRLNEIEKAIKFLLKGQKHLEIKKGFYIKNTEVWRSGK